MTGFIGAKTDDTWTATQLAQNGKSWGLGDRFVDYQGKEWVFVQASGTIAQYDVVTLTAAYAAAAISTSNDARGNLLGVAPVAFTTSDYGWVQVKGPCTMNVKASCAANVRVNTTATAGSPDDDGTTGSMQLQGVYLTSARGGTDGSAAGILNYPYVDVTL